MDNTFIPEKLLPRLIFNPGLALTGFRTTRPWCVFSVKPPFSNSFSALWSRHLKIRPLSGRSRDSHSFSYARFLMEKKKNLHRQRRLWKVYSSLFNQGSSILTWSPSSYTDLRLGNWQRRSSPNFRPLPIADSGTSWECGGPKKSRMRSCGSVQAREDWSYHPEKKMAMDWPHFEEACHQHDHHSLEWNPQGVRRKGRPKMSWTRTIQQDLGLSWDEVKRTAKNRVRWKAVVEALSSGRSEVD